MKAVTTSAIIGTIRSKIDRSIGFTVSTPELTPEEVALFFQLQGINIELTITPKDEPLPDTYSITREIQTKTPSQRLRAVLFILWKQILWKQKQPATSFESWY